VLRVRWGQGVQPLVLHLIPIILQQGLEAGMGAEGVPDLAPHRASAGNANDRGCGPSYEVLVGRLHD
jgi:hypothetical protein